jgi:hypothetical protein
VLLLQLLLAAYPTLNPNSAATATTNLPATAPAYPACPKFCSLLLLLLLAPASSASVVGYCFCYCFFCCCCLLLLLFTLAHAPALALATAPAATRLTSSKFAEFCQKFAGILSELVFFVRNMSEFVEFVGNFLNSDKVCLLCLNCV